MNSHLHIRASADELDRWRRAAEAAGMSLSEYVRDSLAAREGDGKLLELQVKLQRIHALVVGV